MNETCLCDRCDGLAEKPEPIVTRVFGQERSIILCLDCFQLMFSDSPDFYDRGWLKYRLGGLPA